MEHILQFGISIDDDTIKKRIAERAETEILANIKKDVDKALFGTGYWYSKDRPVDEIVKQEVYKVCKENKDYILDKAAQILAEKLARSKAGKALLEDLKPKEGD